MESTSGGASTEGTSSKQQRSKSRSDQVGSDSDWSGEDDFLSSDGNYDDEHVLRMASQSPVVSSSATLLDGDFLEFTNGRPLPLTDRAKAVFHMSVLNVSTVVVVYGVCLLVMYVVHGWFAYISFHLTIKRTRCFCQLSMFWIILYWLVWMKRIWSW